MLDTLEKIVREAGKITLKYFDRADVLKVEFKNPRDIVTNADNEVEAFLKSELAQAFPKAAFFGEETGPSIQDATEVFVADPIDGTTNFFHRYPLYSVSLAYRKDNIPIFGLVYCPPLDQLFAAERGQGATLNGKPIHVSRTDHLQHALGATGFACIRGGLGRHSLPIFNHMLFKVRDIHRDGSAALDLSYLAAGTYDLFWELNLSAWDIAAGGLILQEAGGRISDFSGGEDYENKREIFASNNHLHDTFLRELKSVWPAPPD